MKIKTVLLLSAIILILTIPATARIGIGISPEEQELQPAPLPSPNVTQTTEPSPTPTPPPEPADDTQHAKAVSMRILLASVTRPVEISAPGGLVISNNEEKVIKKHSNGRPVRASSKGDKVEVDGKQVLCGAVISSGKAGEPLKIFDKRYRGKIRLVPCGNALRIINIVDLDQYLYGVVPREFRTKFPEMARAQAVVARTFALAHLGRFEKDGYDFTSGTRFQVYGGFDSEDPDSTKAVDDTRGQVLEFGGKLVKYPLYHSTCGGYTASNPSVYLSSPIAYLSAVPCRITPSDGKPGNKKNTDIEQKIEKRTPPGEQKGSFKKILNGESPALCSPSSYYRWSAIWTDAQIAKDLGSYLKDTKISKIRRITVEKRGPSGRVVEMMVETNRGKHRIKGNAIRQALLVRRANGSKSPLYSTRFDIKKDGRFWKAIGGGWGHGLGLCQYGALGMAKKGYTYRQILEKYYPGTTVKLFNLLK